MSEGLHARLFGRLGDFRLEAELDAPAVGVTALVGPSGCGKTTLLRALAGLARLDGEVRFQGESWQDGARFAPAHLRPVGFVFQEASLFPHLSVRQNLVFGLKRAGPDPRLSLDEAVEVLGLSDLLGRSTAKLSGGERQRVALGRALLVQPRLLLLDEPVSSLDVEGKAEVLTSLERVRQSLATPILYVTHDPGEVARLADRVLVMRAGRIVGAGQGGAAAEAAAGAAIDAMDAGEVRRLALAALMAGLGSSRL